MFNQVIWRDLLFPFHDLFKSIMIQLIQFTPCSLRVTLCQLNLFHFTIPFLKGLESSVFEFKTSMLIGLYYREHAISFRRRKNYILFNNYKTSNKSWLTTANISVTSPVVINMQTRELLAEETKSSFV